MKFIGKIGLLLLFIGCASQETIVQIQTPEEVVEEIEEIAEEVIYFAFDFDTDQSNTPFRNYGAAYIINISNETITIPISTYGNSTMFAHFYYHELGLRPIFTEMMLSRINRNNFLVLEPGDRVLAFSVAFFQANLERYPDALYDARIFINNNPIDIRGHIRK